jgi:8-oxo-dGTP pyrophosphatase MutT (NUDIX family)
MYPPYDLRERLSSVLDPIEGSDALHRAALPPDTRAASVVVPILSSAPSPRVVFTRRTATLSRHAGEISFPGGLADDGEDLPSAALREVEEELGIAPADVELVGVLPSVHTHVSAILIVPFVGLLAADPRFTPNEAEIDSVLEFPLQDLMTVGAEQEWEWEGHRFRTWVYDMDGEVIWGATARILQSLVGRLGP